jgi:hypothetical protein
MQTGALGGNRERVIVMLLSTQLFDRIVGTPGQTNLDSQRKATVLPVGCRRVAERRTNGRVAYGQRTQICRDSGKKAGVWETVMLQDISIKGVGTLCDEPMPLGETFVLKLTAKDGENIRIRCKVQRCEPGGFGNTAFLMGATFEHVIQQEVLRLNDDEGDEPADEHDVPADADAVTAGDMAAGRKSVMARAAAGLRRAVDPTQWLRKSDDFGSKK